EDRCFAGFHDVSRAAHRCRRVGRDHLAGHHPVEQHPYGGELLLDRRCRDLVLSLLDIGRNVMGPDSGERKASILTPREKPIARPEISPTRVSCRRLSLISVMKPRGAMSNSLLPISVIPTLGARWSETISAGLIVAGN